MSSRYLLKINGLLIVPAFVVGASVCGVAYASGSVGNTPAVQTYADQAVPTAPPPGETYYNSPLAAGTLTLEDVLEAHRPSSEKTPKLPAIGGTPSATATAPLMAQPSHSSATGLMLSEGMREVLQKVDASPANASAKAGAPLSATVPIAPLASAQPQAHGQPVALVAGSATANASGFVYQPGQAPQNLAASPAVASVPVPASAASAATAPDTQAAPEAAAAASEQTCDQNVQEWEKSCGEAGYPSTYVGKIVGETRTGCSDGALHDVWVTNTCAPPEAVSAQSAKTDGVCGEASNNEFSDAPTANLCGQGIASAVNGDGPWTWACSGINGGNAAACIARKHVTPVNGACGSANGVATATVPDDSDLCNAGTASTIKGNGPWTWSCNGAGKGRSESCIAPLVGNKTSAAAPVAATEPVAAEAPAAPVSSSAPAAAASADTSADKGELCGAAAETLAYEAPDKDLCREGTASAVNGSGPWTWSCTNNENVTSSCRTLSLNDNAAATPSPSAPAPDTAVAAEPAAPQAAPPAPVSTASPDAPTNNPFSHPSRPSKKEELACGPAAKQILHVAPSANAGLCEGGKASEVRGDNPWHWTCRKGKHKISCETPTPIDAACGPANGAALEAAPFSGLCSSGASSSVAGNGPWTWTCSGINGGIDVSCAASVQAKAGKIDGVCGTADGANLKEAPAAESLCASGKPSAVNGDGPWAWSCSGTNGGAAGSCAANKIIPPKPPGPSVNGLCGLANGVTTSVRPADDLLCASGTLSSVVGNGPWNWSCSGENGGMTVSCTAPMQPPPPIDGACGDANGVATLIMPQSGLCSSGITGAVSGKGPWTWTCSGANGGSPASCIAPLAGKSAATPSIMTLASGDSEASAPTAAPAGLVTPRLASKGVEPSLDKNVLPSLMPSKSFASAPTPSKVPGTAHVTGDNAPSSVPNLPDGSAPLTPPDLSSTLPTTPVLQETTAEGAASIPGNHLTLDPSLSTILFTPKSGNIDEKVLPMLDKLVTVLQNNPDVRISLYAYADNAGSTPRDARRLSLARALAVRDYLSSKGVSESRIDVHAKGANTTSGVMDRIDVKVNA
ncbi:MAG: OmpA family protein [Alphaproteobacteria bacterium]|nr:OmpA family protein [Alphaproteobacteria bacterium]